MTQPKLLAIDVSSSHLWMEQGDKATITPAVRFMGLSLPLYPLRLAQAPSLFTSGPSLLASLTPGGTTTLDGRSGEDTSLAPSAPGIYSFLAEAQPDLKSAVISVLALGPGIFNLTFVNGRSGCFWVGVLGANTCYWLIDPWPYIAFWQTGQEYTLSASYPVFLGALGAVLPVADALLFLFWQSPWRGYTDISNLVGGARVDLTKGQLKPGLRYTVDVGANSVSLVPKTGATGAGGLVASLGVLARGAIPSAVRPVLGDPILSTVRLAQALPRIPRPGFGNFLSAEESLALLPNVRLDGTTLRVGAI